MFYAFYDLIFIEFRFMLLSLGSDVFFVFMFYALCFILFMIWSLSNLDLGCFRSALMCSFLFMFYVYALCFMFYTL